MKCFKIIISKKIGQRFLDETQQEVILADNEEQAYKQALEKASTIFDKYSETPLKKTIKDEIVCFNGGFASAWVKEIIEIGSVEEFINSF